MSEAGGRRDFLFLDDVDRTSLLDDLDDQANAVAAALVKAGFGRVNVRSVLCLVDAEPAWRGSATVGTTYVSKARPMLKVLSAGPVVFDDNDVASLGLALDRQLGRQQPNTKQSQ